MKIDSGRDAVRIRQHGRNKGWRKRICMHIFLPNTNLARDRPAFGWRANTTVSPSPSLACKFNDRSGTYGILQPKFLIATRHRQHRHIWRFINGDRSAANAQASSSYLFERCFDLAFDARF